jgi:general secretion pathway protein L
VATCVLFIEQLDDERILSTRVESHGVATDPLEIRSSADIKKLQRDAKTIVVLPSEHCSLQELPLACLGERKARSAIPYALEEHLAQNVSTLHFAFDHRHYKDNTYLVAVIDKDYLNSVVIKLKSMDINFDVITIDWFALNDGECCVTKNSLLVHDKSFKGALSSKLADLYLNSNKDTELFTFRDSATFATDNKINRIDKTSKEWVALRLLQSNPVNLCQGDFLQGNNQQKSTGFWYAASAALTAVWLVGVLLYGIINTVVLNKKIANLDNQIEVIYRDFFPEAQQVISPRFRIEQLLKSNTGNKESVFWPLLAKMSGTYSPENITIKQLFFQNKILAITLLSKDFATLEALQKKLQLANIDVTQTRASSQDDQVLATLELKL